MEAKKELLWWVIPTILVEGNCHERPLILACCSPCFSFPLSISSYQWGSDRGELVCFVGKTWLEWRWSWLCCSWSMWVGWEPRRITSSAATVAGPSPPRSEIGCPTKCSESETKSVSPVTIFYAHSINNDFSGKTSVWLTRKGKRKELWEVRRKERAISALFFPSFSLVSRLLSAFLFYLV